MVSSKSFEDELNKTRVARIAEVWEHIFAYEYASARSVDNIFSVMHRMQKLQQYMPDAVEAEEGLEAALSDPRVPASEKDEMRRILNALRDPALSFSGTTLPQEDPAILAEAALRLASRNRLWLGQKRYEQVQN